MQQVSNFFLILLSAKFPLTNSNKYISLLQTNDYNVVMLLVFRWCCVCGRGGFDAGGSGLVDVLMVGDREGVVKIDGCLLL